MWILTLNDWTICEWISIGEVASAALTYFQETYNGKMKSPYSCSVIAGSAGFDETSDRWMDGYRATYFQYWGLASTILKETVER